MVTHEDRRRFSDLLSFKAIDQLNAGADLREGQLMLVDASRNLEPSAYVTETGAIDRGAVVSQFRQGATIVLNQLHQGDATLAAFCRAMEAVFSCHVQTNIYLTPPNAQGFRTHYDNHDVFVLQVEGEKAWRFYNTPVDLAYRGENFSHDEHPVGEITHEFVLKAGDVAYLPRGLMHDARTSGDEPSLHITCGLIVKTWADLVLEAVSEVALTSPEFRRGLPPGYARQDFDRGAAKVYFRTLMKTLSDHARLEGAMDLLADQFIRSRDADVSGALALAPRPITPDQAWRARDDTPWRLAEDGEGLALIAPGGDIAFPMGDRAAIELAMGGQTFRVGDLQAEDPERMIARLSDYGLIQRA